MVTKIRTSLSLDQQVEKNIRDLAAQQGRSMSVVANDLLTAALYAVGRPAITESYWPVGEAV